MSNNLMTGLQERLGEGCKVSLNSPDGSLIVETEPEKLLDVAKALRESGFDHVASVTAVDYPKENRMVVVWQLMSYGADAISGELLNLEVRVPRENPTVPSLVGLWESALFLERETYEMFGVKFEGHPDLRPLLLPEELLGQWPMRKDFKLAKRREDLFKKGGAPP